MQEEAMSGMLFWSIGAGVIRKGGALRGGLIIFEKLNLERKIVIANCIWGYVAFGVGEHLFD
jgi:hypothetical protein